MGFEYVVAETSVMAKRDAYIELSLQKHSSIYYCAKKYRENRKNICKLLALYCNSNDPGIFSYRISHVSFFNQLCASVVSKHI